MTVNSRMRILALAVASAAAALGGPAAAALATAPGKSGSIVIRRYLGPNRTHGALFTIAPDGTGERQMTRPPSDVTDDFPDFASDGSFIAFQRCGETCRIYTVRSDGSGLRPVGAGCAKGQRPPRCVDTSYAAISPDRKRIAFVRAFGRLRGPQIDHVGIYAMRLDGSHLRRVTLPATRTAEDDQPQWSPDGRRIVFVRRNVTAKPKGQQAIFVVDADGSHLQRVTPWSMRAGDGPDWSPDGSRILFRAPETEDFLNSNLFTVQPDGTGLRQITHVAAGTKLYSSSFSPDGTSIAFAMTGVNGAADVYTMHADGTAVTPVTRTAEWDSAPDWGGAPAAAARAAYARGTAVSCGQTITHDTTLAADLTNCPGDGLVVGADGITINLNGHTIDGTVTQASSCDEIEPGSDGVRAGGYDRLTIENGTIQQFSTGVEGGGEGQGMADSVIRALVVRDNRTFGILMGSNLLLNNHNEIVGNETYGNGCGAGIFLNDADGNHVARNRSHDNGGGIGICCSPNNVVEDNVVTHNRDTGIAIYFGRHSHNVVRHNTVNGNADGIFVGFQEGAAQDDVIAGNHSYGNTNGAITLDDAIGNQIARNRLDHSAFGVLVFGDANTIGRNQVSDITKCTASADPCGVGIAIAAGAGNVVQGNTVARTLLDAIAVVAFDPGSTTSGTVVRGNLVRAAGRDGYSVGAVGEGTVSGTRLTGNLALDAVDDGFDVHVPGTTLTRDAAFRNGDLGIAAVPGTIDGGGNRAHANGNAAQCTGVVCG